jgi:cytochrome P450
MADQQLVIVNGYDAIKEMLLAPQFNRRPDLFRINVYRQMGGFGFSEPDSCWKSLRKATFQGIRAYGPGLDRVNSILHRITEQTLEKVSGMAGQAFDPWSVVYSYNLHSITAFMLGETVAPSKELYDIVEQMDQMAMKMLNPTGTATTLDSAPWLRHLGHPLWKTCQEFLKIRDQMWDLVSPFLEEAEAASIAQSYLRAKESNSLIDATRVKCAIGDMMIAGTMSTTTSMYCLLQILCHHPHVQKQLRAEIHRVLDPHSPAEVADLQKMPYTRATLLELQRYVSVTPLGLPHSSVEDTTLAGLPVPRGATVLANLWGLHRDPEFWNEPGAFKPERFLDDSGELLPSEHPNRRHILAFGLGPRLCPGENFAQSRLFLFTAALLQNHTLHISEESANVPYQPETFGLSLAIEPHSYKLIVQADDKTRSIGQR